MGDTTKPTIWMGHVLNVWNNDSEPMDSNGFRVPHLQTNPHITGCLGNTMKYCASGIGKSWVYVQDTYIFAVYRIIKLNMVNLNWGRKQVWLDKKFGKRTECKASCPFIVRPCEHTHTHLYISADPGRQQGGWRQGKRCCPYSAGTLNC